MRFRILIAAPAVLAITGLAAVDSDAQFPDPPAAVQTDQPPPEADELIRQLESTASRGGTYRAQAIQSLARLKAWPQVDRWLAKLDAVDDPAELAQSARTIGPELLLRISMQPDISPASESAINKMSAAAKQVNQSLERLSEAVEQLKSEDVDVLLSANRTLLRGGDAAIQTLVAAIAQGLSGKQRIRALQALQALGDGGRQALQQLALYGDQAVRPASLAAIATLDEESALDTLLSSALAPQATASERDVARQQLGANQALETADVIGYLGKRLSTLRQIAAHTPNDASPVTIWSVDGDRTGVTGNRSTAIYLAYRDAYDAAQRLHRITALPPPTARAAMAADLAYRVMVDVDWGDEDQLAAFRQTYRDLASTNELLKTLADARALEDVPASIGLLRVLDDSVNTQAETSDAIAEAVLQAGEGGFGHLVDAVRDAHPRVRYEAAQLIADLLESNIIQPDFAGASYYRKTLSEMATLNNRPLAILLETRPVVALRQETILGQLGYEVRLVRSALQAERAIAEGGDVQMVVSKIRIADVAAPELVDRIRRLPRGSRVPIVFFNDDDNSPQSVQTVEIETTSNRWISEDTPGVYMVPLPGSPAALAEVLREVESKRRLPPLSVSDRAAFQRRGTAALQGESQPR
ncbi:hypothetical protein [Stieleria tagensis]|uniref:hypothetical protein n=1 Tax=Stieleria tagensis TaxID=2956795 RepID=UPI00209B5507|nr:hypothetical protein [Stieleria tagensis]